jgi:hypothetical protein
MVMAVVLGVVAAPQLAAAETVPLPSGAGTGNTFENYLSDITCLSPGNCVATGSYGDSASDVRAMIETQSAGTWTSQQLSLNSLPSVFSDPEAQPSHVSCSSPGNCVAVGNYDDASDDVQGLIATETNGSWSAAQLSLSGLGSVDSDPGIDLNSLACPAAGDCVAVGSYTDGSHHSEALIATETNGAWTAAKANLASLSPYSDPGASLADVSCPSVGNCVATGTFNDSADQTVSLIATETNGTWSVSRPDLSKLPNLSTTGESVLWGLSCPSTGNCTVAGHYLDNSSGGGKQQPMVVSETGGTWGAAAPLQPPANVTPATAAHIYALSCASVGNCTAVGDYHATASSADEGFSVTETAGTWAPGVELSPPSDAAANPGTWLESIACTAPGSCVAAGTYTPSGTNNEILIARLEAGSWTSVGLVQPTTAGVYANNFASVTCTATGDYCAVDGSSVSWVAPDNSVAFLDNAPGPATAATATASGTSAQVSWNAPLDNGGLPVSGYTVTATDQTSAGRGGQSATVGGAVGTVTIPGLTPGDSYTFTITPTSLLGSGLPATASVTVPAPPNTKVPAPPSTKVPFSTQQLTSALSSLLAPSGPASRLKRLRRTHSYTFRWTPLEAGAVTVRWFTETGRGKHRRSHLIASGSATAASTVPISVTVKLNRRGERLVRLGKRVHLMATIGFASDGVTVSARHTFTLR